MIIAEVGKEEKLFYTRQLTRNPTDSVQYYFVNLKKPTKKAESRSSIQVYKSLFYFFVIVTGPSDIVVTFFTVTTISEFHFVVKWLSPLSFDEAGVVTLKLYCFLSIILLLCLPSSIIFGNFKLA